MSEALASTPAADGYRMPGEFEPHSGCWMLWPERTDNWREQAAPAQRAFAAVAGAIAASEPVTVGVSREHLQGARAMLPAAVDVVELAADDAWMRDVGPTFVVGDGGLRGVDWRFNAWGGHEGGLYAPWDRDELVAARVLDEVGAERYAAPIVLEGGSIHCDGEGTVLTTEECLLNHNRNPERSREEIERLLCDYLGAERVIWLGRGVPGDETDGHIDNLACFARPGAVLLAWCDDESDPQHEVSEDARRRLADARDARGRSLEVVLVPMPGPLVTGAEDVRGIDPVAGTQPRLAGTRLAASYVNFYVANDRVIFPLLDERHDAEVADLLRQCFRGRDAVGVPAREILLGGGNIHCITQQVPAVARIAERELGPDDS
jgi:agmatine deiminase